MRKRTETIATLNDEFDVAIIGGGINGAVSAAALSAHGVKVVLLEANDFASMTSQESSNMVWGGIKYLQDYEFSLVWKLCKSRNQLLAKYPNRIKQIPFFAVIGPTSPFSRGLGFAGTILYWVFGRLQTDMPKVFSNKGISKLISILNLDSAKGAIQYNDAILLDNDSRFVYEFIKTAELHNASVLNYVEVIDAKQNEFGWQISVHDKVGNSDVQVRAKVLVNATGPYTRIFDDKLNLKTNNQIVISKGVHLIVPRIDTKEKVLAFFDNQGRLFYILPMHDRTVIGTTDTTAQDASVEVTDEDREFLLAQANRCLNLEIPITKADIIAERCGVRPLVTKNKSEIEKVDWISLSRKHVVELKANQKAISIFGGKITDCINIGNEVVHAAKKLGIAIKPAKHWFGEPNPDVPATLINKVEHFHPLVAQHLATELWRRHSNAAFNIVAAWEISPKDAELIFEGLLFTTGELKYIAENEHVVYLEDLLRRRTPISLLRSTEEIQTKTADLISVPDR